MQKTVKDQNWQDQQALDRYTMIAPLLDESLDPAITSAFVGYDVLETEGEILALTTEEEVADALTDGQAGTIITDR